MKISQLNQTEHIESDSIVVEEKYQHKRISLDGHIFSDREQALIEIIKILDYGDQVVILPFKK